MNKVNTLIRKNYLKVFFLILLFMNSISSIKAVSPISGRIVGKVIDKKTGKPLFGSNIMVLKTVLGSSTDIEGKFLVINLPIGIYDVEASMMGYKKQVIKGIQIYPGQESSINFQLEPTILQQPTLVVTATKRKQHIEDSPVSVDVVSTAEIRARGAITLDEVLQNTAGFGIIDGQIDLRGSSGFNWSAGSRVLLMIDGHPLINGDTGGINWDAIPVEEVQQVEIVKGAGSALYGSNAMAGMVNIITQNPSEIPETRFKLSWGFYNKPAYSDWCWTDRFLLSKENKLNLKRSLSFEGIDLTHSRRIGKTGLLFTVGRKRSSGYQQNGDFSRWNLMGKANVKFSPNKALTVTGNWALNDHGDIIQWISKDRPLEVPSEELGNRVRYAKGNLHTTFKHGVNQKLAYTLKGNIYRCHWKNFFYDNADYAITDRIGSEIQVDYLHGEQAFTFGGEITTHHVRSLIYGVNDTWDFALYGEDEIKFSPLWTLTLGTRYDYHKIAGVSTDQQISPRFGLVYRPLLNTSLRLSAGHGFRAPSIAEVFANITVSGFRVVPNLDLKDAERAWSFELGVRQELAFQFYKESSTDSFLKNPFQWTAENLSPSCVVDLALFWSRYKNMIDVNINPELSEITAVQFMNMGRARINGAELRVTASTFNRHLLANIGYTLLYPKDLDTGKTLNYRSKHRITTGIEIKFWNFTFGWDYRYASRIEEVVNILGSGFEERVPMHVMDARIILNLGSVDVSLEGKNLRNYHYTLRQRYLEPIRSFIVYVRGKF